MTRVNNFFHIRLYIMNDGTGPLSVYGKYELSTYYYEVIQLRKPKCP